MNIFVLNAGSSSLKYSIYRMPSGEILAQGNFERIGIDGKLKYRNNRGVLISEELPLPDHDAAFGKLLNLVTTGETAVLSSAGEIDAVGHRVVHGGVRLSRPVIATEEVIAEIERYTEFAPLHTPAQVSTIRASVKYFPASAQVVVFDTAFHQTIPPRAYLFALPYRYYEQYGIRRYGFHGISHDYVSGRAAELMGRDIGELKIVTCHLGNGSSVAAVDCGRSIDCTTGFGTFDGLMMGTRSGQIDPAAVLYIEKRENMSVDEVTNLLARESGLLGISGISSDDREVEKAAQAGDSRAALARSVQCYQIRKYIGAFSFAMGGLDAIVFTAGIGENSATLRAEALSGLERCGVVLDPEKNEQTVRGSEGDISADGSPVRIFVIPTNEEFKIAQDTLAEVLKIREPRV